MKPVGVGSDERKGASIPCLVVPPNVTFVLNNESTHKQIITVYNPYEFPLQYKILTTHPSAYQLSKAKGQLRARSTSEIIVRLRPTAVEESREDKFLVEISDGNTIGGKKIVKSVILTGKQKGGSPGGSRRSRSSDVMSRNGRGGRADEDSVKSGSGNVSPDGNRTQGGVKQEGASVYSFLPLLIGIVVMLSCIPWKTKGASEVYELICVFSLGLLTMFFQMKMIT